MPFATMLRTFGAALFLALTLAACSNTPEKPTGGDNNPGIGPFMTLEEGKTAPKWEIKDLPKDRSTQLRIRNLMGNVEVLASKDGSIAIELMTKEGKLPAFAELREYDGGHHLLILDHPSAIADEKPQQPTILEDGRIERFGLFVPRVDVRVKIPENTTLTIDACAELHLNASGQIRARVGSGVSVKGGGGDLMVWTPVLAMEANNFDLYAEVSKQVNISGNIGCKVIRGDCNVEISSGTGLVDIDVGGEVLCKTVVSGGIPGTNLRSFAHRDGFALIGPVIPVWGTRGWAHEKARIGSSIKGKSVRVYLDKSSRLEVEVQVSAGEARFLFGDPSIVSLHEWSPSTGSISIGNPTGQLNIRAVNHAEVLIE